MTPVSPARAGSRQRLGAIATTPAPLDIRAVRRHFAFPELGRIVTNNAASTQPPRELLELYQSLAPRVRERAPRAVERLAGDDRAVRGVLRHDRALHRRAGPGQHRAVPQHDRGHQRGHVLAADRIPRRRQRRDHADGAQLQLRARGMRCAGRSCRGSGGGWTTGWRASIRSPASSTWHHLASLIDARTKLVCCTGASNFLGTKNPLAAIRALADAQRLRAARRRAALVPAGRRRPAGAGRRSSTCRPSACRLPGVLLPQDAGAVRGRRAVRQGAPARVLAAVPVWR